MYGADTYKVMVKRASSGRRPRKLTEGDINRLVTDYNNGATQTALADKYHIARSTVWRYLKGRKV